MPSSGAFSPMMSSLAGHLPACTPSARVLATSAVMLSTLCGGPRPVSPRDCPWKRESSSTAVHGLPVADAASSMYFCARPSRNLHQAWGRVEVLWAALLATSGGAGGGGPPVRNRCCAQRSGLLGQ